MGLKEKVQKMVLKALEDKPELFFVGSHTDERNKHFRFVIDGDVAVSIEDLTSISRQISAMVDEDIEDDLAFTFEISSPGADSPLLQARQYPKHIGRKFDIDLISGESIKAVLLETDDKGLVLEKTGNKKQVAESVRVDFAEIKESKIIISFK
jgi:ribosome maturation factor RimP